MVQYGANSDEYKSGMGDVKFSGVQKAESNSSDVHEDIEEKRKNEIER